MTTPITGMPEIAESQANKYITHNEALRRMEALSFRVLSRTTTAEPASPADGDSYIIPASATGANWAGQDGNVGYYDGSVWHFVTAFEGLGDLWVMDEDRELRYDGTDWIDSAAFALDRANHTGTQPLSTISDAGTAAAADLARDGGTVVESDIVNTFTTRQVLESTSPEITFIETDGALNKKRWDVVAAGEKLLLQTVNDDGSNQVAFLEFLRSGAANFTTMPQVGGDPIVEEGSNSNGYYARFASGLQICTTGNIPLLGGASGLVWNYPAAFVTDGTEPSITGSLRTGDSNATLWRFHFYNTTGTQTSVAKYDDTGAQYSGQYLVVLAQAIGRWK